MSCYVCGLGGELVARFDPSATSESKLISVESTLSVCPGCGLLHTQTAIDLARYYAEEYEAKLTDTGLDEIVSTADGQVVFRTDLDYALMMHNIGPLVTPESELFEYGCGRARILSRLHKDGFRNLSAFDLSEHYRATAAPFCGDRVHIGTRPSLSCDLAYSFFVLEHDTDPVRSLLYLHRSIRPGGHLYLMLPNYITNVIDLACADHVNHFSPEYLSELLGACGFEMLTLDDSSNIGSVVIVARRKDVVVERATLSFARPELVRLARDTAEPFLRYMAQLGAAIESVERSRPLYLYGAGFYATLVHAQLAARGIGISGVFDANPRKAGTRALGHSISPADAIATGAFRDAGLFVCVNPKISNGIAERYRPFLADVHSVGESG